MPGNRVYLESTFVSYLAARPSSDLVVAAHQLISHTWWDERRTAFDLYVSELVLEEIGRGDTDAAGRRLALVAGLPLLAVDRRAADLAASILSRGVLPAAAHTDALHVAVAAVHQVDYLLTWNCRHLANASLREPLETACVAEGYRAPVLCSPEELLDDASTEVDGPDR